MFVDGPVGLAHRRLAIVDVSTAGEQPMTNEDGSVWIAFNGEIYNHASLRPGLEARGHRYRSRCDTETIIHLYEEEGDRVVDQLRGMFAFAIWDNESGAAAARARRLGIKPLYYAVTERELVFASEIKSILAAGCDADVQRKRPARVSVHALRLGRARPSSRASGNCCQGMS